MIEHYGSDVYEPSMYRMVLAEFDPTNETYFSTKSGIKRNLIDPNMEVFQFLTERSQKNSVYELFGWRELNWDQISKTYRPKAVVDAVNLFRVQL